MYDGPSKIATCLAGLVLRGGRYPGRALVASTYRRAARLRRSHRFTVTAGDGVKLDACYLPAVNHSHGRLTVVILHGWLEIKELYLERALRLNGQGHGVVVFDHRAHGCSEGDVSTFGVREHIDTTNVIDTAGALGMATERVITMGHSMGGATALQHAAIDSRVAGVVAFAPFLSFEQAIESFRQAWVPWIDRGWVRRGFDSAVGAAGFDASESDALEAMRQLQIPVMLVEGGLDRNLPPVHHTRPLAAAKADGKLEIFTVAQATHYTLPRQTWPGLDDAIERFCTTV